MCFLLITKHTHPHRHFGCAASPPSQVHETNELLKTWMQRVDELRNQYNWLLFFSVPKLLLLYNLMRAEIRNLEAIVHEISFLCSNEQGSRKSTRELVEVRGESERERRIK